MARGFVKSFAPPKNFKNQNLHQLWLGCLQHYNDDKIFHASEFFNFGSDACIKIINEAGFQEHVQRKWFLGHVMFEIFLDRLLVQHTTSLTNNFYKDLVSINTNDLVEFCTLFEANNIETLMNQLNYFINAAYIKNYANNNLFVYSLVRIMQRAKAAELTWNDRLLLNDCLLKLDREVLKDKLLTLYLLKQVFA